MKNKDEKDVPVPEWRPVRPFTNFPPIEPQPFDTRDSTYIPDLSVEDSKVSRMSARKIKGIGIKVYSDAGSQTISHNTTALIQFNQIAWQRGMETSEAGEAFVITPHTGVYLVTSHTTWATHAGLIRCAITLDATTQETVAQNTLANVSGRLSISVPKLLQAGDQISVTAYQASDTAADRTILDTEYETFLSMVMLFST